VRAEFALHCIAYNLRVAAHFILPRIILIIFGAAAGRPPPPLAASHSPC
jgi:hypothetical protein